MAIELTPRRWATSFLSADVDLNLTWRQSLVSLRIELGDGSADHCEVRLSNWPHLAAPAIGAFFEVWLGWDADLVAMGRFAIVNWERSGLQPHLTVYAVRDRDSELSGDPAANGQGLPAGTAKVREWPWLSDKVPVARTAPYRGRRLKPGLEVGPGAGGVTIKAGQTSAWTFLASTPVKPDHAPDGEVIGAPETSELVGTLTIAGDPDLRPGQRRDLAGFSPDVDGRFLVTSVSHYVSIEGYDTIVSFIRYIYRRRTSHEKVL